MDHARLGEDLPDTLGRHVDGAKGFAVLEEKAGGDDALIEEEALLRLLERREGAHGIHVRRDDAVVEIPLLRIAPAEEAEAARKEAIANDETLQLEMKRAERKERKAAAKADARARREAKSAARRG